MRFRPWLWFPIGVGAGVLGLLPWLVHGMRLPVQNLWLGSMTASTAPIVLLPLSQYSVSVIAGLLIEGGAIGGLVALIVPGRRRRPDRVLLILGTLAVQVTAIVQAATAARVGLRPGTDSAIYLGLLVAGSVLSILIAVGVEALVSSPAPAAVVMGVALAAPLSSGWAGGFVSSPFELVVEVGWTGGVAWVLHWLPSVLVGLAIAWSGLGTAARTVAAVFGLVSLWVGSALIAAISNAVSARVYARQPQEMLRFAGDVFRSALGALDVVVPMLVVAIVLAAVGIAFRRLAARRRATTV